MADCCTSEWFVLCRTSESAEEESVPRQVRVRSTARKGPERMTGVLDFALV